MKTTKTEVTENVKNFLSHNIDINNEKTNCLIKIRLSDPCKNGHNDFAITADFWKPGTKRTDRNWERGGCTHEEILKMRPELKIFVDLHLSDYTGAPMHPSANGFYHLKNSGPKVAQGYIRATNEQFDLIKDAEDETHFKYLIESVGLVEQWKREALQAIAILEQMTGEKFVDNSTKRQYTPLTESEKQSLLYKISTGYYLPESIEARRIDAIEKKKAKKIRDLQSECDGTINRAKQKLEVDLLVLNAGLSLDNFILYDHTKEGIFNWYDGAKKVSQAEFEAFLLFAAANSTDRTNAITWKLSTKGK